MNAERANDIIEINVRFVRDGFSIVMACRYRSVPETRNYSDV